MNKKTNTFSRREFTKLSATALAAIPLLSFDNTLFNNSISNNNNNTPEVHLFSKHLQFLDYNEMSEVTKEMGFNGLDLTVRRKGHVLPENVEQDLPKAVEAMKKADLDVKMMSTNVWDADDNVNKTVLTTASALGIKYYRTNWLTYPEDQEIAKSQKMFGKQAKALEKLNKELGLIGAYQNHSGKKVGAPIWDLLPILETTNGTNIGSQYDIRHAVLEGANSWELGLNVIRPYINSIVLKDVKWGIVKGKWKPINVPMGEGMVDFKRYFHLLKKYNINVPISLHVEYDLGGAEKGKREITMDKKEVFAKMKKDLNFIKETWNSLD